MVPLSLSKHYITGKPHHCIDTRRHRLVRVNPLSDQNGDGKTHRVFACAAKDASKEHDSRVGAELLLPGFDRVG
jgi:hypothetical protein